MTVDLGKQRGKLFSLRGGGGGSQSSTLMTWSFDLGRGLRNSSSFWFMAIKSFNSLIKQFGFTEIFPFDSCVGLIYICKLLQEDKVKSLS